jgi:predicted RNase H-like HicB family nuclease
MATIKKNNYQIIEQLMQLPWTYAFEEIREGDEVYFVITVNELSGVCTDAPTKTEAMKEIKEAMIGAFQMYIKHGQKIPVPKHMNNIVSK